jgi:hypothetical protein
MKMPLSREEHASPGTHRMGFDIPMVTPPRVSRSGFFYVGTGGVHPAAADHSHSNAFATHPDGPYAVMADMNELVDGVGVIEENTGILWVWFNEQWNPIGGSRQVGVTKLTLPGGSIGDGGFIESTGDPTVQFSYWEGVAAPDVAAPSPNTLKRKFFTINASGIYRVTYVAQKLGEDETGYARLFATPEFQNLDSSVPLNNLAMNSFGDSSFSPDGHSISDVWGMNEGATITVLRDAEVAYLTLEWIAAMEFQEPVPD